MIKFHCKNCGHKIGAPEHNVGKKGKCPKCRSILVVPKIDDSQLLKNRQKDSAATHHKTPENTPEPPPKKRKQTDPPKTRNIFADNFIEKATFETRRTIEKAEETGTRELPWLVDILFYPTSTSGLVNLAIFWLLPILISVAHAILPIQFCCWIPVLRILVLAVIFAYMLYYLTDCIRDSAKGGTRAPENMGNMPDMGEVASQFIEIAALVFILWAPATAYFFFRLIYPDILAPDNIIFGLLIAYAVFFFPMALLALAMFNSSTAFNPFLWVSSIFSTFFRYCLLVLLLCALAWLFAMAVYYLQQSLLIAYLFGLVFIYLAMLAAHLLGRFYYVNSDKLRWDV